MSSHDHHLRRELGFELRLTGLGIGTMIQPLHADRRFIEVVDEDVRWWGLSTGGKLRKEVSCLVVMPEDVMKLESPEPLFEMTDLFAVCHHLGVTWSGLLHDLVDNEFRIASHRGIEPQGR